MSFVFWIFLTFDPFLGVSDGFSRLPIDDPRFKYPLRNLLQCWIDFFSWGPSGISCGYIMLYHPVARYDPVARLRAYDLRLHEARLNASVFVTDLCEGRWGMVGKRYGKMASSPRLPGGLPFGKASGTSGTSAYYEPVSASSEQVPFLLLYDSMGNCMGYFYRLLNGMKMMKRKCHVDATLQEFFRILTDRYYWSFLSFRISNCFPSIYWARFIHMQNDTFSFFGG